MASREKITFKIALDESGFLNGLKKIQKGLEVVAEKSKKGTITHAEASKVISGLTANLEKMSTATAEVANTANKNTANVKTLSETFKQLQKDAIQAVPKQLIDNLKSSLPNALQKTVRGTQELKRSFSLMRNVMSQGIDSVRQITQGFLSMGRALTFFVAIPFTAWLKESIQSATDFESAMARVTKVAGFDADEFGVPDISGPQSRELNQFIRDISEVAGSSQQQFAQWAEDLAQFGVDSVDALKDYLPMMEMMASGTDVAASDVAKRLGNVANAFGFTMSDMDGQARNFVWRMINVINELENSVGASSDQILTAVEAAGPTLSQLGVPAHVVASWAALGVEAGLSADEVGTGLRNLGSFMSRNFVKAFDSSQTALRELFGTSEEMHKQMRIDFSTTFTKILTYYSEEEDQIKVIAELYDFLGQRAGKLATALIQAANEGSDGAQRLITVMEQSAEQFKNPISLANEYKAVQKTLAYQTQQLKNTITNLALTVGDDLIPELKNLVQIAIPVVKATTNLFASLDDGTKKIIFFGSAVVALSGPILFFVSQMSFGASLIMSGLIKLGGVLGTVTKVFGVFGLQLLKLNPVAWLFAGTISRAFGLVKEAGVSTVNTVSNIFGGLAKMMPRWGQGIFDGLADGIEGSASRIAKAVNMIAQIISSFFEAHSPPDVGPLQHIDKWGTTLFDTYLEGFAKADFGILKDVAGYISHILSSWIDIGKLDDKGNMEAMLLQFREDFAGLISQFNEFGSVADSAISAITERFGEASDEIFKLIKLNFQLKSIIEDIEGVEQRKKEVTQAYRDQVRDLMKSNMSLEEQAQLLGQLQQERDKDLAVLDEEQEILEARKEAAQEELDFQKQLLDAYKDQDDIFADMLKAMEDIKNALGSAEIGDVDIGDLEAEVELEGMAEAQEAMASFSEAMANLNGQALKLELTLKTVFSTIGRSLKNEAVDNMGKVILETKGMDERLQGFAETALKSLGALATDTDDYAKVVQDLADIFGKDFLIKFFKGTETAGTKLDETGIKTQVLKDALEAIDDEDLSGLVEALSNAEGGADDAFTSMTGLGEQIGIIFDEVMDKIEPAYKKVRAFFLALGGQEVPIETRTMMDGTEIEGMDELIEFGKEMNETWTVLETRLGNILKLVGEIGDNILSGLGIEIVADDISGNVDAILGAVQTFLESIASIDKPIRWAVVLWLAVQGIKTGLQIGGQVFNKMLVEAIASAGIKASLATGGTIAVTVAAILLMVFTGIKIVNAIKNQKEVVSQHAEQIKDIIKRSIEVYGEDYIQSKDYLEALKKYQMEIPMMVKMGEFSSEEGQELLDNLTEYILWLEGSEDANPKFELKPSISWVNLGPEDLSAGINKEDPFGIKKYFKEFDEISIDPVNIQNALSRSFHWQGSPIQVPIEPDLDIEGFKSKIENIKMSDVESIASTLGVDVQDVLTGKVTIDDITIPAPDLIMEGLQEKVLAIATEIKETLETELAGSKFAFSSSDQENLALALISAIASGLESISLDTAIMASLALKMVDGLLTASGNEDVFTKLTELGKLYASTVEEAFNTNLFATEAGDSIVNFTALVTDLKVASENLGAGFLTALESLDSLIALFADEAWLIFKDDVDTLGGTGEGSIAKGFIEGENSAKSLKEFLEGDFLSSLETVVSVFNRLMSGNWTIDVRVVYDTISKWQTGGSAIPSNFGFVGETGRELFSPPIRGHITSHSELSSILSGEKSETKKEINLNVTGSPVQMTEDDLMRMLRRMEFLYG